MKISRQGNLLFIKHNKITLFTLDKNKYLLSYFISKLLFYAAVHVQILNNCGIKKFIILKLKIFLFII